MKCNVYICMCECEFVCVCACLCVCVCMSVCVCVYVCCWLCWCVWFLLFFQGSSPPFLLFPSLCLIEDVPCGVEETSYPIPHSSFYRYIDLDTHKTAHPCTDLYWSKVASGPHQGCIRAASGPHQGYIRATSGLHQVRIRVTSRQHQGRIRVTSGPHQGCILFRVCCYLGVYSPVIPTGQRMFLWISVIKDKDEWNINSLCLCVRKSMIERESVCVWVCVRQR